MEPNSISAHDFVEILLLQAFNSRRKFDKVCLSDTFLNSSLESDDDSLVSNGYKLIRTDNPSDLKRGGACISFKESLKIKVLNITNFHECLVCTLFLNGPRFYIVSLCQSPSQSSEKYEHFIKTFEQLIVLLNSFKLHLLLITDNFNASYSNWWSDNVGNIEGTRLISITSFQGLHQIINEPTHILPSSFLRIDLIFTNQVNMITDSVVDPSLQQNCCHKIIFGKVTMEKLYPPPHKRLVWDYGNANVEVIKLAIESFN